MVKVGVVGAGNISPAHGIGWNAVGAELWVYSLEGAETFAATFGATQVDSLDELLAAVEVVDVVTPTPVHAEIVEAALRAGKDVICEKPLTRHVPEGEALVALASEQGRRLYPAHVVRWFPQHSSAHEAVAEGRLGDLAVLRFTRSAAYPTRGWYADPVQSGGIVMDLMIHDLDQAVWFAGPPRTVHAVHHRTTDPHNVETCLVTMTHDAGVISHCRGLWGGPSTPFSYSFHLSGTGGVLRFDLRDNTSFRLQADTSAEQSYIPTLATFDNPYAAEIADFHAALAGGAEPRVDLHDGLTAVRVAEAAIESLSTGQPVVLKEN